MYSDGASEVILGAVLRGRRDDVLVATKVRFPMGSGPNDGGLSRHHLIRGCEDSLRRLQTGHLDLYQLYEWDGLTPVEETLEALMKAVHAAERDGLPRVVSQQICYSLQGRDAAYELIPAAVDQGLRVLVWSPLAGAC